MKLLSHSKLLLSAMAVTAGCCSCTTSAPQKLDMSEVKHGIVCFTFDDGAYETWLPCREIFKKYNAHATFFYWQKFTPEVIDSMRLLMADGHTVGSHGVAHLDAPQVIAEKGKEHYFAVEVEPHLKALEKAGIAIDTFAYPNNRYDDASNALLKPYFRHFRAGVRPYPGVKGYRIADYPQSYYDLDKIAATPVLGGHGIGPYYLSTQENIDAALERAAKENKLIVFFSHKILPEAEGVNMSVDMLEASLKKAHELGMKIAGFDDLP